ncbi:hypothetical protein MBLNU459_g5491t1 [Dothideomycetes sp. NU459]
MDASQRRAPSSLPTATTADRSRVSSAPSAPDPPRQHHRHLSRRHHRHHHARDTIQSAVQLQHPFSFDSYNPLKRAHHGSSHTADSSSRPSFVHDRQQQEQDQPERQSQQEQPQPPPPQDPHSQLSPEVQHADEPTKRVIRADDVARERQRRERRQEDVAEALAALSRDAHTATRKLDDTYYSLLERLGSLRATLASLQQLAAQARGARRGFGRDADTLAGEVRAQIGGFDGYRAQERTVDDLVVRLRAGRDKAAALDARLETCRGRLEAWERREHDERKQSNRRWAVTWAALATLLALVVAVAVWRRSTHRKGVYEIAKEQRERLPDLGLGRLVNNKTAPPGLHLTDATLAKQQAKDDDRWNRLLDEL